MAKDSYYFPHDHNARNDRKIAALIKRHKSAGYGVFWIICEMMHEEDGSIEFDEITFGAIAKDSNEDSEFIKTVINDCITDFKLFSMEQDIVISGRVSRNLEKRQEISKSRSIAGKRGAIAKQTDAKKEKEIKERNKGIFFSESGDEVTFQDGSSQKLGISQKVRFLNKDIKPEEIIKGQII